MEKGVKKYLFLPSITLAIMFFFQKILISRAEGALCTYYNEARSSSPVYDLPNCTWYRDMACCKRTEVSSIMGGMFKIHETTDACKARLHYMMCYFCSPEQIKWYDTKVYVCSSFCDETFEECKTTKYQNETFEQIFTDGTGLCEANSFEVVPGEDRCFNFDKSVFAAAEVTQYHVVLFLCSLATTLFIFT